ncbi:tRNA uridine-5-carboxymethylaminomethyl(34) synthesis GTPase MnmE [Segatella copri]|uniref:tRNA uridine-5-carboxymethylaminomethyl(34) synthesis GTPase MnmE n=1 Tax=Segatella copri TaxID=165179 RepID=UPI001F367029|nr:tRNA uridine-5-carboxymethylaminomethyl(34) synthesis GTPase MnmE [Segatella copri]
MKNQEECICALATPAGGAIGIIRLSGHDAITLTDKIFQSANGKSLEEAKPYTLHYGEIKDKDGSTIDDVLVSVFRAPHSYTGENSTEISCHGSRYILQQVLHRFTEVGCRQAEPGEYTRRAYLNGKMDLSQAEAVADLIASTNKATHKMALSQLKGHFSNELSLLREKLLKMTSLLELELDFSDHEELEFADRSELQALAEEINHKITTLAHSFETGNALKQGVAVAIVGKTNVGKSTLLNRLLHEEKAIVSDIHGTTRDVIEDTTLIDGITFRFIDTAGIRKTDDVVENIGIERTFQKMEEAKIVIWLLDEQPSASEIEEMKLKNQGKKLLVVFNKMDKLENDKLAFDKLTHSSGSDSSEPEASEGESSEGESPLFISARTGENVSSLEQALVKAADIPEITENDVIITSARHYEALLRAHDSLSRVLESMEMGMSGDIIAEDLKMVLEELGEITGGQISSQETLNNIFKHFCIGK